MIVANQSAGVYGSLVLTTEVPIWFASQKTEVEQAGNHDTERNPALEILLIAGLIGGDSQLEILEFFVYR